jgi:glycosyl transferase family 25
VHIKQQINNINFDFIFINDGDKESISQEVASRYFKYSLEKISGVTSCAYKHILAYEDMIANKIDYAVILEDDIFLHKNFENIINDIIIEIKNRKLSNILISLEDSIRKFVKGSEIKNGQILYLNKEGRFTGAYLIDMECAQNLLNEVYLNKCGLPIDHFHNHCATEQHIHIYWSHPTIATQGSSNGKIASMLEANRQKRNYLHLLSFYIGYVYKKILWKIR